MEIDATALLQVAQELHDLEGRWPADESVLRSVHRLRGQTACSLSTADLILTRGFARPDLIHWLLAVHPAGTVTA
jgi:hypothetical protein